MRILQHKRFVLAMIATLLVTLFSIGTLLWGISHCQHAKENERIELHTLSGDPSALGDIKISGSISKDQYLCDFSIGNTVSHQTQTPIEPLAFQELHDTFNSKPLNQLWTPEVLRTNDVQFQLAPDSENILLTDTKTPLKEESYDSDLLFIDWTKTYSASKIVPTFSLTRNNYFHREELLLQPDYTVTSTAEDSFVFCDQATMLEEDVAGFSTDTGFGRYWSNIHYGVEPMVYSSQLSVLMDDTMYVVPLTLQDAVGSNSLYSFSLTETAGLDFFGLTPPFDDHSNEIIKDSMSHFTRHVDIPITVEGETNQVVACMANFKGYLAILICQEVSPTLQEMTLQLYDPNAEQWVSSLSLGEVQAFEIPPRLFAKGDYLTCCVQTLDTARLLTVSLEDTTLQLAQDSNVNVQSPQSSFSDIYFDGDKLYCIELARHDNAIQSDSKPASLGYYYYNRIAIFEDTQELYCGELRTDVYQDYLTTDSYWDSNDRTVTDLLFELPGDTTTHQS